MLTRAWEMSGRQRCIAALLLRSKVPATLCRQMSTPENPGPCKPVIMTLAPAWRPCQRRQLRQLGRIIDNQGLPSMALEKSGVSDQVRPTSSGWVLRWVLPPTASQATTSACSNPIKGLRARMRLSSTCSRLWACARVATPAQQGLGLLPISGLPAPATHQLHQRGLQFVTQGFEFAIAYHLESSTVSALEEDYARHHEVAVCQLTMG